MLKYNYVIIFYSNTYTDIYFKTQNFLLALSFSSNK